MQGCLFGREQPDRSYPVSQAEHIIVENDLAEASTNSPRRRINKPDGPATSQAMGPSVQLNMVLLACRRGDDQVLLIEHSVSSDTWLMDAIAPAAASLTLLVS